MPRGKPRGRARKAVAKQPDGFINVPVSDATRHGLHILKDVMGVGSQADVIEKLVAIGLAIHLATRP